MHMETLFKIWLKVSISLFIILLVVLLSYFIAEKIFSRRYEAKSILPGFSFRVLIPTEVSALLERDSKKLTGEVTYWGLEDPSTFSFLDTIFLAGAKSASFPLASLPFDTAIDGAVVQIPQVEASTYKLSRIHKDRIKISILLRGPGGKIFMPDEHWNLEEMQTTPIKIFNIKN